MLTSDVNYLKIILAKTIDECMAFCEATTKKTGSLSPLG